jgi:glycosyltransferase involved in cell wall biosynthesis
MKTVLLISPYWKESHRWMVSSVKLAELWQRLGYRVIVACMGSESSVERVSETLEIHRRKDFFLPDPWNYGIAFGFSGYVRRLASQTKPDLIVVNKLLFWTSLVTIPLRLSGHRVLVLTDAFVGMTWWPRGLIPKIGAFLYAWTLGWLILLCAERLVTFHPQPEGLLKRLGIAKKTVVIPTGIDTTKFQVPSSKFQSVNAPVTVTYIGRLESVKGVDDFLAAAISVKKLQPDLRIQVVGWHKDRHPLVEHYRNEVIFTGLRDDIPAVLGETDIFVLPSYSEGLSNALMEAMASGCACIASDVGGSRFLIQNGVSGFLFPAGDREALAAHLRRLLDDPSKRKQMGEAARKRINEHFSWDVVGKMYGDLFRELTTDR